MKPQLTNRQFNLLHDAAIREEKRLQDFVKQTEKSVERTGVVCDYYQHAIDALERNLKLSEQQFNSQDYGTLMQTMQDAHKAAKQRYWKAQARLDAAKSLLKEFSIAVDVFTQKMDAELYVADSVATVKLIDSSVNDEVIDEVQAGLETSPDDDDDVQF